MFTSIRLAPTATEPAEGFGSGLENLVATVVPGGLGDWVAESVVRPFVAYPSLGLTLLLVLALSYYLGLFSRLRLERIHSRFWRRALPEGWRPAAPPRS